MSRSVGFALPDLPTDAIWINNFRAPTLVPGPVLFHFWAKSCPACKFNMAYVHSLRDRYSSMGLHVVAVHMPRGEFDLDINQVMKTAVELGITEPCLVDNYHDVGDMFEVRVWPSFFLFGSNGLLKRHAVGVRGIRLMEVCLREIYGEPCE